jgi:hypothetical protein
MKRSCSLPLLLLTALFLAASTFVAAATCPPEGQGSRNDPKQNVLKNRDTALHSFEEMTVGEFKKTFKKNLSLPTRRENFTAEQLARVEPDEKRGVTLTSYILRAVKQGPETANCGSKTRTDIHVWLYSKSSPDKSERTRLRSYAVVAEVTPRWLDSHPTWTASRLEQLGKDRTKMRVSGWVMYDPEHPPHLGKTRGTLWELHPITKIEVWSEGAWREL